LSHSITQEKARHQREPGGDVSPVRKIGRKDCGPNAKAKRELRADPRAYDATEDDDFMAAMYGVTIWAYRRWVKEFNDGRP